MKYLSTFSGIESASVAWEPLGWEPVGFSEIEPFPSAVLNHRFPNVTNYGDITKFKDWPNLDIRLLVGGSPCQSFSIAGLRKGMDDPRGNLMLTYLAVADKYKPTWIVWENVPGVLSSNGGKDFASFLGGLAELGYGFAYRVLDAQYVRVESHPRAVPQRRRRVFVVGCLGSWQRAAAVLFERESLLGHPAPSRQKGEGIASGPAACLRSGGDGGIPSSRGEHVIPVKQTPVTITFCDANGRRKDRVNGGLYVTENPDTATTLTLVESDTKVIVHDPAYFDEGQITSRHNKSQVSPDLPAHTIMKDSRPHVIFKVRGGSEGGGKGYLGSEETAFTVSTIQDQFLAQDTVSPTITASNDPSRSPQSTEITNQVGAVLQASMQVRRLTPVECERLQGFPDNWTNIPWKGKKVSPDGPRYKACGNSMAVNVMRWIGDRIQMVDSIK